MRFIRVFVLLGTQALSGAHADDFDPSQALVHYQGLLKQVYASQVKVSVVDRGDGNRVTTGTYHVYKPVVGEKPQREPINNGEQPPKSALMDLPADLAVKPELALPLGDRLDVIGAQPCDEAQCVIVRTSGDLNGKGKVFFEARIRLIKTTGVPLDSTVTMTKIPFADHYSYNANFTQSAEGFRLVASKESFLLKVAMMKLDLERSQVFSDWKSRD